ncbi:MAG: GntR family transcriptional regulator [Tetrasphaera sp.]|jgi:DNA-binding transcriptional regulator YhcF (GntR family)|nr:GntR family transcriptional regulator [Tetrasphaera sp.]
MILTVEPGSVTPAYEQIVTQVMAAVRAGSLSPGTRLPTVRQLAGDLGLAANTVGKAYRQLESDGYVATNGRNGTVVAAPPAVADEELTAAAVLFVRAARRSGLALGDALGVIRSAW